MIFFILFFVVGCLAGWEAKSAWDERLMWRKDDDMNRC